MTAEKRNKSPKMMEQSKMTDKIFKEVKKEKVNSRAGR